LVFAIGLSLVIKVGSAVPGQLAISRLYNVEKRVLEEATCEA